MNSAKDKIKEAFLTLYTEKPIEKISVKLLTETAGINRGTFYDHYLDIYDLRDQIENEFISQVTVMIGHLADWLQTGDISNVTDHFDDFYQRNDRMLNIVFNIRPNIRFQRTMKYMAQKNVCRYLGIDFETLSEEKKYILDYISGGQISIVSRWFSKGNDMQLNDFIDLLKRINMKGAFTCLLAEE